jgi:hypothetical protein
MDKGTLSKASTQYNDLIGSVAVDFEGSPDDLESYAKANGIDTEKYDPVGINLYGGHGQFSTFEIFCVDRSNYPIADGEDIPVIAFSIDQTFENLFINLKRIGIVLHSKFEDTERYKVVKTIESDGEER